MYAPFGCTNNTRKEPLCNIAGQKALVKLMFSGGFAIYSGV